MSPDDLSPADLGNGYRLSFQKHPTSGQVRAVVKDSAGVVVVTGPTVLAVEAFRSRLEVLGGEKSNLWMPGSSSSMSPTSGPDDEDDNDEEEEDEEDDD